MSLYCWYVLQQSGSRLCDHKLRILVSFVTFLGRPAMRLLISCGRVTGKNLRMNAKTSRQKQAPSSW